MKKVSRFHYLGFTCSAENPGALVALVMWGFVGVMPNFDTY